MITPQHAWLNSLYRRLVAEGFMPSIDLKSKTPSVWLHDGKDRKVLEVFYSEDPRYYQVSCGPTTAPVDEHAYSQEEAVRLICVAAGAYAAGGDAGRADAQAEAVKTAKP